MSPYKPAKESSFALSAKSTDSGIKKRPPRRPSSAQTASSQSQKASISSSLLTYDWTKPGKTGGTMPGTPPASPRSSPTDDGGLKVETRQPSAQTTLDDSHRPTTSGLRVATEPSETNLDPSAAHRAPSSGPDDLSLSQLTISADDKTPSSGTR